MKRRYLMAALWGATWLAPTTADELRELEQGAITAAVARASDSVVQIETVGGLEKVGQVLASTGPTSGVVVASDGYIISSAFNFITQPASIIVTLSDGSKHAASIVSRDGTRMSVLLKIECEQNLPVPQAVPRSEMQVGQWTIALGKTYDHRSCNVSVGILSADDRVWGRAIQTDAKVSPVNYGGALIDIRGDVLGILVPLSNQSSSEVAGSELYDSGIGFAIPLVDVFENLERMKTGKDLQPGLMGITLKARSLFAEPVVIATCPIRSPAAEAGFRVGDEIVSVNGARVRHQADLKQAIGRLHAGDIVEMVAIRDGKEVRGDVKLTDEVEPYQQPYLGILAEQPMPTGAVRLRHVFEGTPAEKAGLQPGDELRTLDGVRLESVAAWREALMVSEPGQVVSLAWKRGAATQEADIPLANLSDGFSVPERLPPRAEASTETEIEEVKVLEESMRCRALVPDAAAERPHGLLVWLPADPKPSDDALREAWAELACRHDVVVLLPEPEHEDRWEPAELLTVRKMMDEALRTYNLSRSRIVLVGAQAGGAVAYRLSAANRDLVRGVCVADAQIPRRTPIRANDPVERVAYLLFIDQGMQTAQAMAANAEALRKLKLPVVELEQPLADQALSRQAREIVARWCDAIDRL